MGVVACSKDTCVLHTKHTYHTRVLVFFLPSWQLRPLVLDNQVTTWRLALESIQPCTKVKFVRVGAMPVVLGGSSDARAWPTHACHDFSQKSFFGEVKLSFASIPSNNVDNLYRPLGCTTPNIRHTMRLPTHTINNMTFHQKMSNPGHMGFLERVKPQMLGASEIPCVLPCSRPDPTHLSPWRHRLPQRSKGNSFATQNAIFNKALSYRGRYPLLLLLFPRRSLFLSLSLSLSLSAAAAAASTVCVCVCARALVCVCVCLCVCVCVYASGSDASGSPACFSK